MKKSKKFVLAGLVLLAAIGLLVLAGCKNDTVPEPTAAKLVSITVTPPTKTVYGEGDGVDFNKDDKIEVTVHDDDGATRSVTGTITTDTSTLTQSAGVKTVAVSYSEGDTTQTATFTVDMVDVEEPTKLSSYISPNHTGSEWTYVEFGEWPQTIKVDGVTVDKTMAGETRGGLIYYKGSDGAWYVEAEENAYGMNYKYSDGTPVGKKSTTTKWFKVEPIVWRVLTEDYKDPDGKSTSKALLLAEKILTGGVAYYVDTAQRTIGGQAVHTNSYKYSTVRAWLNGSYETDDTQDKPYNGTGFLQSAFTQSARKLIATTTVDNSKVSTNPDGKATLWNGGENQYACADTVDKVFLLSEREATTAGYGFDKNYHGYPGSTRIRATTDYAKDTGASQGSVAEGYGGRWWLRSPYYNLVYYVHYINNDGDAYKFLDVRNTDGGVVPALWVELK